MNTNTQEYAWLRLPAAVVVAFIASMGWLALYSEYLGFVGPYWANTLIGFLGVLVGSFCFRRQQRFLGSVILLIGGVAFDALFEDSDDKIYPLSVVWVAIGGLAAVFYNFLRRPAIKALQATAASPGVFDTK